MIEKKEEKREESQKGGEEEVCVALEKKSSRGRSQLGLPSWRNTWGLSHPLVSSFPFAYFRVQSSTLAPLLTSSLSFVLSVFPPIVLVFLLVCVCVFFFVCRCFARHTPIAYVRLESFQFLLLWGYPRLN